MLYMKDKNERCPFCVVRQTFYLYEVSRRKFESVVGLSNEFRWPVDVHESFPNAAETNSPNPDGWVSQMLRINLEARLMVRERVVSRTNS